MKQGGNVAIMAVDPGGHTGLAWGIFDLGQYVSLEESLNARMDAGSATIVGSEQQQILTITSLWRDFLVRQVRVHQMQPERVQLVMEDFGRPQIGGRDLYMPLRLIWGVIGFRMGEVSEWERSGKGPLYCPPVILQQPGTAAMPKERQMQLGLWVRGKEHERSAWRHVVLRLRTLRSQPLG